MSVYDGVTHSRLKAINLEADSATLTTATITNPRFTGVILNVRKRLTVAQVNAGVELVAAVSGKSIRMIACKAIAIGAAATTVTTVDVTGTATTARKLVAYAQASLTQSTVLTDGGSGATVLADGASYTANDAGTAINVSKTGGSVAGATHIDVIFDYVLE